MKCASCSTENSAGAKFCRGCGASLAVAVPPPAPEKESPRAPAVEPGKVASSRKGVAWIAGIVVVAAVAGGGGYAWYQHVESGRAAEERAPAESARVPEPAKTEPKAPPAAEQAKTEPPVPQAPETPKPQEPKPQQAKAQPAKPRQAAAAPVALGAWRSECSSIPEGLKKTWCEERAKEKFCGANPRSPECR